MSVQSIESFLILRNNLVTLLQRIMQGISGRNSSNEDDLKTSTFLNSHFNQEVLVYDKSMKINQLLYNMLTVLSNKELGIKIYNTGLAFLYQAALIVFVLDWCSIQDTSNFESIKRCFKECLKLGGDEVVASILALFPNDTYRCFEQTLSVILSTKTSFQRPPISYLKAINSRVPAICVEMSVWCSELSKIQFPVKKQLPEKGFGYTYKEVAFFQEEKEFQIETEDIEAIPKDINSFPISSIQYLIGTLSSEEFKCYETLMKIPKLKNS